MANQLFLVSSPFTEPGKPLNENNKFVERLLKCEHHSALMVTSAPSDIRFSESFSYAIQHTMALSGITFENYIILDYSTIVPPIKPCLPLGRSCLARSRDKL